MKGERHDPSADGELGQVIANYLEAVDEGRRPARMEFLAHHPHLADELGAFLDAEESLAEAARPLYQGPAGREGETIPAGGDRPTFPDGLPAAGAEFGDYDLLELIGEGGMGVVYRARDRRVKRIVALKLIRAGRHATPSELARFRVEAEAAARLSHPGIVQLYEVGHHDGQPFLASEYCDGGSLADRIGGQPRPAVEAARTVAELADAVQAAHDKAIVHRDLKPANVLISATGRHKIGDFGLAKLLDAVEFCTRANAILGSPSYMSPEQAAGKEAGFPTDVYALGAILYELLVGRPPFRGATPTETLQLVVSNEPVPPQHLNRTVPSDLQTICLRCLEKDPARRFATPKDLADELGRYLRGEPILSRPVRSTERAWRWCKRNPVPSIAALVVATVATIAVALIAMSRDKALELAAKNGVLADEKDKIANQEIIARRAADRQAKEARWHLYVARMYPLTAAWERRDLGQLERLLKESTPRPGEPDFRGWEWYYLQDQVRQASTTLGAGEPNGHRDPDRTAAWCRRTGRIGVATAEGAIEVWDESGKKLEQTFSSPDGPVRGIAWSPDGERLACATSQSITTWEIASGRQVGRFRDSGSSTILAWSPDGRRLASGAYSGDGTIKIWDAREGVLIRTLRSTREDSRLLGCLSWHPDGVRLAAACSFGTCHVWDTGRGELKFVRHNTPTGTPLSAVAWSPDGKRLAAGNFPDAVIYDEAGRRLCTLRVVTQVMCLDWSPDGARLLTGSSDHSMRVWNATTGSEQRELRLHDRPVRFAAWSPDGGRVISGGEITRIYDLRTGDAMAWTRTVSDSALRALLWSPNGSRLVCAGYSGRAYVHDAATGRLVRELPHDPPNAHFWSVAQSPGGERIVTLDYRSGAIIWDAETGTRIRSLPSPTLGKASNSDVAWSPDGKWVVVVGMNGNTVLWDARKWEPVATLVSNAPSYWCVAWSHDGRNLACGSWDGVTVWDIRRRKQLFRTSCGPVQHGLAWSRDGTQIAAASNRGDIFFIRVGDGTVVHTARGHKGEVTRVQWSPDGRRIASASWDGTIKIWDAATAMNLMTLPCDGERIHGLAWSPDGRRLASVGFDGTLRIWGSPNFEKPPAGGDHLETGVLATDLAPAGSVISDETDRGEPDRWIPYESPIPATPVAPPQPLPLAPPPRLVNAPTRPISRQEKAIREKVETLEQKLARRPGDPANQFELAQAYGTLAQLLLAKPATAKQGEATYREAIVLLEDLCRDKPGDHEYHRWLGATRNNLAIRLPAQARFDEKRKLLEGAVAAQLEALKIEPGNARSEEFLANHYSNLAKTLASAGDHGAACTAARKLRDVPGPAGANATRAVPILADCWSRAATDNTLTPSRGRVIAGQYAAEALACLRLAAKGGPVNVANLRKHRNTARLFLRPEFKEFLKEIESTAPDSPPGK